MRIPPTANREHMGAHGSEHPFRDRRRRERRRIQQKDQLVICAGDGVHPAEVAANEQGELAQQSGGAGLTNIAAHHVDPLGERGADDNAPRRGSGARESRQLVKRQLTSEIFGGSGWADQRSGRGLAEEPRGEPSGTISVGTSGLPSQAAPQSCELGERGAFGLNGELM